jgi:transcription termination/antitermination protein NusG
MSSRDNDVKWYAVQVRPHREFSAATILFGKDVESFVPRYKSIRKWSDRRVTLELPLFPGYIFCRFNVNRQMPVITTAGVMRIVGRKTGPVAIEAEEIEAIKKVENCGCEVLPHPFLESGDKVRIEEGPLAGLIGIVQRYKNQWLILSLALVERSISVQLGNAAVTYISPTCRRITCPHNPEFASLLDRQAS